MTAAPEYPSPSHHRPAKADGGMEQPEDSDSRGAPRNTYRPPEYAVVISASDWVKEQFPAAGASLWDALRTGKDCDPEPDLEAEP